MSLGSTREVFALDADTVHAVLDRFGMSTPTLDLEGLRQLYRAWCRHVPFDNLLKRIHLAARDPGPLPAIEPADFFATFLHFGTGGTCWPTSSALHALLFTLGFDARLGVGSMHHGEAASAPNHATALVRLDGDDFLVDSSMLFEDPLPLRPGLASFREDALHPLIVEPYAGLWEIQWRNPSNGETLRCRLLDDDVDHALYVERYEETRKAGVFNSRLYVRLNVEDAVIGVVDGRRFEMRPSGRLQFRLPQPGSLSGLLVQEFGFAEELVARLPPDE